MNRRSPLNRTTPLEPGGPLQRRKPIAQGSGLKRSGKPSGKRPNPRRDRLRLVGEERKQLRLDAYDRAGGHCEAGVSERCPGVISLDAFEWHHRKLRSQGGDDTITNSLALCHHCHEWAHQHPEDARMRGLIVPRVSDPAERAVNLWDGRVVRLTEDGGYDVIFDAEGGAA